MGVGLYDVCGWITDAERACKIRNKRRKQKTQVLHCSKLLLLGPLFNRLQGVKRSTVTFHIKDQIQNSNVRSGISSQISKKSEIIKLTMS